MLYLMLGKYCHRLKNHVVCMEISELCCTQKEADAFHALQQANRDTIIIILM